MDYDDRAAVTEGSVPSMGHHPLQWPDYLVLASFLVISLGIGLYHALTGGRQKTVSEFIMANRDLQIIPTSISLLVSFQSAIMVLGMTAEMFGYGSQLMVLSISSHALASVVTVALFVPWLFPLKLVSVYEVCMHELNGRYGVWGAVYEVRCKRYARMRYTVGLGWWGTVYGVSTVYEVRCERLIRAEFKVVSRHVNSSGESRLWILA